MKSSLPLSDILKLIELVKNRPFIWNTKHEMYNDRYLVANGWKEIQDELQHPEHALRLKWRNIRDVFRKEIKKHPCKNVEDYNGKWQFFQATFFVHAENQSENDDSVSEQDTVEDYLEEELSLNNQEQVAEDVGKEIKIEFNDEETDNVKFFDNYIEENLPEKEVKRQTHTNDYDLMFLRSLVPYFSYISPMRKLVLRSKLQDILLKELAEQEQSNESKKLKVT